MEWTPKNILIIFSLFIVVSSLIVFIGVKTLSPLGQYPYQTFQVTDNSFTMNNQVYPLPFDSHKASIGFDGENYKVCKGNRIYTLNANFQPSLTSHNVSCCSYADCSISTGTGYTCNVDWINEEANCKDSSLMPCTNYYQCPGSGDWVPDWHTSRAKKYYCYNGYCTVTTEKTFECWDGEGCPVGSNCVNHLCTKVEVSW
jgi:hypothetical protein